MRNMYCVVRANSTSGPWIVERTSHSEMSQTRADVLLVTSRRREAEHRARAANQAETGG